MGKFTKVIAVFVTSVLLSLGIPTSAQAEGFYIGAGVYQAETDFEGFDDDDTVPSAFVGYTFIDTNVVLVSEELGYYDLGEVDGIERSGDNINIDSSAITFAGVIAVPLGPMFEIYAKAGIASVDVEIETPQGSFDLDGDEAFFGFGASLDILDTIDIYTQMHSKCSIQSL